jgi:hypothetical protein
MLSSPDAKPQQWRALWSGPAIGCEAEHDLVFARARQPINSATCERRYQ